ncbi:MAG: hypothetical protein IJ620_06240 [Bacteroidales bacterium]|nr:hypothetical protein [Bacteroidales bacterium]
MASRTVRFTKTAKLDAFPLNREGVNNKSRGNNNGLCPIVLLMNICGTSGQKSAIWIIAACDEKSVKEEREISKYVKKTEN